MNFFFGLNNELISSEINIPKFNFFNKKIFSNYKVYKAKPDRNNWKIESLNYTENDSFFLYQMSKLIIILFFFLQILMK